MKIAISQTKSICYKSIGKYKKKLLYSGRKFLFSAAMTIMRVNRVRPDKVLLDNAMGRGFGCNLRAIAEELHRQKPGLIIIWPCASDKARKSLPSYITPVSVNSFRYFYELTTCGTWVFNAPPPSGLLKRKQQLFIETGHGDRPLKKSYYSNIGKKKTDRKHAVLDDICDYCVAGSVAGEERFRSAYGFHGKLLKYGMPRNDCLVNHDALRCKQIRTELGICKDERLVLFAPTFRQGKADLQFELDFDRLLDLLEEKTHRRWKLLCRAHKNTSSILVNCSSDRMTDVSEVPDMADLLLVSDFLISDYSSVSGDFCLTHRPIVLFLDEDEDYRRSLCYDMEHTPYLIAHTQKEIENLVSGMDEELAWENDEALIRFFGIYESGKASEEVCRVILEHVASAAAR